MTDNKAGNSIGLIIAILIGITGYCISIFLKHPALDPLVISLLLGVIVSSITANKEDFSSAYRYAPSVFIPFGIVFYGAHNLNFMKFGEVDPWIFYIIVPTIGMYFISVILIGKILRQKDKITYLIATGSGICGASAIAITSPAVDADADDVSISLLSVTVAAFSGVIMILPLIGAIYNLPLKIYSELVGSVVQFTGLVKLAPYVTHLQLNPDLSDMIDLALSIKAVRYLGLLFTIPVFASMIKKRIYLPWYLWIFIASGVMGSVIYASYNEFYRMTFVSYLKPLHGVSWSIAMAAVGLNANIRHMLSTEGTKALIMSYSGFIIAIITFFVCYNLLVS